MWGFSIEHISLATYGIVFLGGIMISFSPCVYPILPVLIGYLGAAEVKTRKEGILRSLSYILGIAVVFSALGAIASLTGGMFGMLQSSFWVNFFVANVFIVMGLFMLDVFQMPQFAFYQKIPLHNKKGIGGAFLLGAVSGLVIGPCTTPVLGAILAYVAAKHGNNIMVGTTLLFVYALGMGFPLLILGSCVGLLKKMPKSGLWMVRIKKVFGLLLIASGEYFLIGMR